MTLWGAAVVICLQRVANVLHMIQLMPLPPIISCFMKIQNGVTFLVPAYHGCPWKSGRHTKTDVRDGHDRRYMTW